MACGRGSGERSLGSGAPSGRGGWAGGSMEHMFRAPLPLWVGDNTGSSPVRTGGTSGCGGLAKM